MPLNANIGIEGVLKTTMAKGVQNKATITLLTATIHYKTSFFTNNNLVNL